MNKWPKVLVFSMVGAGGTVLNTVLLLAVLFRGSPASSAGASVQNDPSAQSAARAALCLSSTKRASDSPLTDLMAQFHCTRADAWRTSVRNAAEELEATRFRCSSTGAVDNSASASSAIAPSPVGVTEIRCGRRDAGNRATRSGRPEPCHGRACRPYLAYFKSPD